MSESNYYYFTATLPLLDFGQKPPLSYKEFLEDCRRLLKENDFQDIERAQLNPEAREDGRLSSLRDWNHYKNYVHNTIVRIRASEANEDAMAHMRDEKTTDPFIEEAVKRIAKEQNPLKAEEMLDRLKWQFLDDLSCLHSFDLTFLMGYALKLQILERHQIFRSPKGKEIFEGIKETALSNLEQAKK